jgi:hypothetical protein
MREGVRDSRHLVERAGGAHSRIGNPLRDAVSLRDPGRGRPTPIVRVQASALDLGETPGALGLERTNRPLELIESMKKRGVRQRTHVRDPIARV